MKLIDLRSEGKELIGQFEDPEQGLYHGVASGIGDGTPRDVALALRTLADRVEMMERMAAVRAARTKP